MINSSIPNTSSRNTVRFSSLLKKEKVRNVQSQLQIVSHISGEQ